MATRTCAIMEYTDGRTSRYGVFRGSYSPKRKTFNAHTATRVGEFTLHNEAPDYSAMAAKYATADAPPVYWQCIYWPIH